MLIYAKYSVPLCLTYVLQYSFSLVTIFVVGHIGTDELGAVSLATMTANISGLAVYEGLATSLDTLCAQAYGGGKKELVGLHLQRMVLFMLLVTVPIGAVWLCSGWILAALVPEKELAYMAGRYLRILLAGAPGYAIFEAGKRQVNYKHHMTPRRTLLCKHGPLRMICPTCTSLLAHTDMEQIHAGTRFVQRVVIRPPPCDAYQHSSQLRIRFHAGMGSHRCCTIDRHLEHAAAVLSLGLCILHPTFKSRVLERIHPRGPYKLGPNVQVERARYCHD